jgi:hypothetical protein
MDSKIAKVDSQTHIHAVEQDGSDGLLVTFSDGTTAGYVAEELLSMRPIRESVCGSRKPVKSSAIKTNGHLISRSNSA